MKRKSKNRREEVRKQKKIILIVSLVCACLLAGIGISYFSMRGYVNRVAADTIYDHIYIESVNVSGMKKAEAKSALEKQVQKYQETKISLNVGKEKTEAALGDLGFAIKEIDKLVEEAAAYGKNGNVWGRYLKVKKLEKEQKKFSVVYQVDKEKTKTVLEEKAQPLEKAAANASLTRENGAFVIHDEEKGQKIDIEASVKAIEKYLNKKWDKKAASVKLISMEDEPQITRKHLEVIQDVLGTFTTYCGSGGGRVQNIVSGTGHINGAIVMPGQEYSANAAMEPYTFENGYAEAGSYESGKVVQSMGGGICQVSTTLYNAVLLSELEVTQRQPHSMLVNYVQPSMDAAIAGTYKDLKFKNNTEYPIYIEGYVSGGNLTFTIYGKETRPEGREVEYISETLSSQPAGKKFEASNAALGTMQTGGSPHTGKVARLWKVVRENGVEVSREIINNSTYNASPTIVSVGISCDLAEASAIVKNAIASQDENAINAAIAAARAKIEEAAQQAAQPPEQPQPPQEPAQPPAENNGGETPPAQ